MAYTPPPNVRSLVFYFTATGYAPPSGRALAFDLTDTATGAGLARIQVNPIAQGRVAVFAQASAKIQVVSQVSGYQLFEMRGRARITVSFSASGESTCAGRIDSPLPLTLSTVGAGPVVGGASPVLALTAVTCGWALSGVANVVLPLRLEVQATVGAGPVVGGASPVLALTAVTCGWTLSGVANVVLPLRLEVQAYGHVNGGGVVTLSMTCSATGGPQLSGVVGANLLLSGMGRGVGGRAGRVATRVRIVTSASGAVCAQGVCVADIRPAAAGSGRRGYGGQARGQFVLRAAAGARRGVAGGAAQSLRFTGAAHGTFTPCITGHGVCAIQTGSRALGVTPQVVDMCDVCVFVRARATEYVVSCDGI